MSSETQSIIAKRREQMFPVLAPQEIDRLRRFGNLKSFNTGDALAEIGKVSAGLAIILSGKVDVTQHDTNGHRVPIVTHGPGSFLGELAQLSGRPSLVDARAKNEVEALIVGPQKLQALLIAEAELGERIMRALILRRVGLLETGGGGPVIVGPADNSDVLRLQNFLGRNGHPHLWLDPTTDAEARALIERFHVEGDTLPIVLCPGGQLLQNPSETALARCIGLVGPIDATRVYDVAVVGAGPAGMAAAVYAASEGLSVLVLDCRSFGGQAGASARIENYLGFPTGITGMALMARAYNQAQKFGAEFAIPTQVVGLESSNNPDQRGFILTMKDDERVTARAVVLAGGVRYRHLDVQNVDEFEGSGVHYWASPVEGRLCSKQEVVLVGAGNSAGQAVVYLASRAAKVWLLARGGDISRSMSQYLVERIRGLANVDVQTQAEVTRLEGRDGVLDAIHWRTAKGEDVRREIHHLFLFIGADPESDWLSGSGVRLDPKGFVLTGAAAGNGASLLETSVAGVFAIGDIRAGSIKRVAAGVGEGAQVVAALHTYLASVNHVRPAIV
ncbi:FAD-dependent oxidoreductase [Hyphomicrobium sp. ghe19]|uniref:FAD-dependent oxidoreductase n=1 Tax=Hyphomicrobium sp. ghe19 TaxID=2682968 RepID=UPI0013677F8E|nr:Thioredoxin reductase [Hyphomicrobium sp. ghe19]